MGPLGKCVLCREDATKKVLREVPTCDLHYDEYVREAMEGADSEDEDRRPFLARLRRAKMLRDSIAGDDLEELERLRKENEEFKRALRTGVLFNWGMDAEARETLRGMVERIPEGHWVTLQAASQGEVAGRRREGETEQSEVDALREEVAACNARVEEMEDRALASDARERGTRERAEAIILALLEPYTYGEALGGGSIKCPFCDIYFVREGHHPECIWERARLTAEPLLRENAEGLMRPDAEAVRAALRAEEGETPREDGH